MQNMAHQIVSRRYRTEFEMVHNVCFGYVWRAGGCAVIIG